MKRLALMAALVCGICFSTHADDGWCRRGTANLTDNGNGTSTLGCPNDGTCYETDNTGLVTPGHTIYIHYQGRILAATVVASSGKDTPPSTPPSDDPTDELPSTVVVKLTN